MEEYRKKVRNALLSTNVILLTIIFALIVLHARQIIEINQLTTFLPLIILLIEAVVFLSTFKYLKLETRKIIVKILLIVVIIASLITAFIFIYERITGYIFIYKYTYGFLLISFLIYPAILLVMLWLINKYDSIKARNTIVTLTAFFVVVFMLCHGVIGGLGQRPIEIVENPNGNVIYLTDSFLLHGTEYEYKQINKYFMEYVGISREW